MVVVVASVAVESILGIISGDSRSGLLRRCDFVVGDDAASLRLGSIFVSDILPCFSLGTYRRELSSDAR